MCLLLGTMALLLSRPSGARAYYQDGQYLVNVRYGQWYDLKDFVQPSNADVLTISSQYGPDYWALYDWVCSEIQYRADPLEFFQFPSETIARRFGDCEDSALLTCSLLRNFADAYVVLGNYQGYGHAWCQLNGQVLETTYTRAGLVPDPQDYCPYVIFNDQEVIEFWPGALDEVFQLKRDEATKLNLLATALQGGSANPGYRYAELPSMCVCHECGYTVANPGVHCPQLGECPVCHAPRLWRA